MKKDTVLKKSWECVRALDILRVIKNEIEFSEDYAVDQCILHLEEDGQSFVELHYYDLLTLTEQSINEECQVLRVKLEKEKADKLYLELSRFIELPRNVYSLHTHLKHGQAVIFEIKLVPLLK